MGRFVFKQTGTRTQTLGQSMEIVFSSKQPTEAEAEAEHHESLGHWLGLGSSELHSKLHMDGNANVFCSLEAPARWIPRQPPSLASGIFEAHLGTPMEHPWAEAFWALVEALRVARDPARLQSVYQEVKEEE